MTSLLATITAETINEWRDLALVAIAAIGAVAIALGTMVIGVAWVLKSRMDALHGTQQTMQTALNTVQQAMPTTAAAESAVVKAIELQTATLAVPSGPVAPPAARPLKVDPTELADLLKPHLDAAVAKALASRPTWQPPSPTIPPKA